MQLTQYHRDIGIVKADYADRRLTYDYLAHQDMLGMWLRLFIFDDDDWAYCSCITTFDDFKGDKKLASDFCSKHWQRFLDTCG